jgi:hypothetical protein
MEADALARALSILGPAAGQRLFDVYLRRLHCFPLQPKLKDHPPGYASVNLLILHCSRPLAQDSRREIDRTQYNSAP